MKKIELNPIGVLLCFVGLALISAVVFSLLGVILALVGDPNFSLELLQDSESLASSMTKKESLTIIQVFSSIGAFLIPALLIPLIFKGYSFKNSLHTHKPNPVLLLICASILFYGMLVLTATLTEINSLFPISDYWELLENKNLAAQKLLIKGTTTGDLLISLGIVALLPAVVEELTFRGIALHLFDRVFNNKHVAIFLQGAIFGLIHFNMGQILPIMGIGILFGYIAYETKSIWYTVLLHFFNNALAAVSIFYADQYQWAQNLDTDKGLPVIHYIFGLLALGIGIYLFYRYKHPWFNSSPKNIIPTNAHLTSDIHE